MRNLTGLLLGLAAVVAVAGEQYGAPLNLKTPVTLEAAVQSLGDRRTADVLVESTVAKVGTIALSAGEGSDCGGESDRGPSRDQFGEDARGRSSRYAVGAPGCSAVARSASRP